MTKDHLAIPDFANNGMIQSVPSDPLLRSLTVVAYGGFTYVRKGYFLSRELKIWLQVDKSMLNSARSAFWGFTPGVSPFFTPRG